MSRRKRSRTVAVTGVGAIIGQGIVRSLRKAELPLRIIGIDRNQRSPGTYITDVFEKKPDVPEGHQAYLDFWSTLVERHNVELVLPGLEIDMLFLDAHREQFLSLESRLALNNTELIRLTLDKWNFNQYLDSIDYPCIPSARSSSWDDALERLGPPPLLLKPLQGNGSRGIVRLHDARDFEYWTTKTDAEWMLQRIVGNDLEEYTVGVFGLGEGKVLGPLTFRRRLSVAGNTVEAEVVRGHRLLDDAISRLCADLHPVGPTNFQFRVEGETCYLLEVNPRFSSSNSLRTAFGFNEAAMAIDYYLLDRIPDQPKLLGGIGWRISEDFVVHAGRSV